MIHINSESATNMKVTRWYSTARARGPGARAPPIHARMPATSARYMSQDLVDSAHPPRATIDAATHAQTSKADISTRCNTQHATALVVRVVVGGVS